MSCLVSRDGGSSAVYSDSSLIVEHCFDTIAEVEWYGPGKPAGDDDVVRLDVPALRGQLVDQPDNTGRGVT